VSAFESAGFGVDRVTYAFASVFPLFAAERLARRVRERATGSTSAAPADAVKLADVASPVERLLTTLSRVDQRLLATRDLPFGSSLFVAATKPLRS
jgi:hypothetical protein